MISLKTFGFLMFSWGSKGNIGKKWFKVTVTKSDLSVFLLFCIISFINFSMITWIESCRLLVFVSKSLLWFAFNEKIPLKIKDKY